MTKKVYSASDFECATAAIVIESGKWVVDKVTFTKEGSISKTPLFKVELKQLVDGVTADENGYVDSTMDMVPDKAYFVRDGRPMYNELMKCYTASDGDVEDFANYAMSYFDKKYYRGRVERLSGILYTIERADGSSVQRSRLELWYPEFLTDESLVMDDFIHLCNKGVYKPIVEKKKEPKIDLSKIDPAVIAAIKAMK